LSHNLLQNIFRNSGLANYDRLQLFFLLCKLVWQSAMMFIGNDELQ